MKKKLHSLLGCCGAYGHKSKNCTKKGGKESKQSSGGNGFKWKCFKCHKEGHKAKDGNKRTKEMWQWMEMEAMENQRLHSC